MNKPKIILLRGAALNSWEMQNYEQLMREFEITAIAGKNTRYDTDSVKLPVTKLTMLSDIRTKLGPFQKLPGLNRLGDRILGLEGQLTNVDIVHSVETFNVYSHQVAQLKPKFNYKLVLTVWENIPFLWDGVGKDSTKVHRRKKDVISATDAFIAVTERAKEALLIEGVDESKIDVVSMGIDTSKFAQRSKDQDLLQRMHLSSNDFVILTIANLHWYKGVQDLVFAAAKLKREGVIDKFNIKFMVVGDGPERTEIYHLIDQAGVHDIFRTVKRVPYEEIPKFHNLADLFFLGSWPAKVWQEQFGMVLAEAMASGVPIVTAKSGSIPEVVEEVAMFYPSGDYYQLGLNIRDVVADQTLRDKMRVQGRKRAEDGFSHTRVANEIGEIYHEILNNDE